MANKIPLAIADFETSLSVAISAGATSLTLSSATDDDGTALPAGMYCFTVNNGSSNKQYLIGQLNGTAVTSVKNVSRQGVETTGAGEAARAGSPIIISDFATIQRVADILRGQIDLDGGNPVGYDAEPTLADRKDLATVGYVLDTVTGGTVNFDSMTVAGNAGEAIVAGNLVYFKTSDQEWYKTDADTAATVEGVQLGIALGTGSDGVAITGGLQTNGTYTTSALTPGALQYASNTAGALSESAGTTSRVVGIALSSTKLLLIPRTPIDIKDAQRDAVGGGGDFGTPSSSNLFLTESFLSARQKIDTFTSDGTWTKPTGAKSVMVQVWGAGGSGAKGTATGASGGGGGGYSSAFFPASIFSATVAVVVGTGGSAKTVANTNGTSGESSSFGSFVVYGGGGGETNSGARGGGGGSVLGAGGQGNGGNGGGYVSPLITSIADMNPGMLGASGVTGGNGGNGYPFDNLGGGGGGYATSSSPGNGGSSFSGGGGGGGGIGDASGSGGGIGGTSIFGGAGGGGCGTSSGVGTGGTSSFGGAGGAGVLAGAGGIAGSVPGGGGGATYNGTASGAGGDGKVIVMTFF